MRELIIKLQDIDNTEEEGFLLRQTLKATVIINKRWQYFYYRYQEIVMVIQIVSAVGQLLPPMYICKGSAH